MQPEVPCFIFDGGCGFCRRWAGWLARRLPDDTVMVPFRQVDDLAAFGLSADDVTTASYWIDEGGHAHGGAASFAFALRGTGPPWGPLAAVVRAPIARTVARLAYRWIARNRHRLPAPAEE